MLPTIFPSQILSQNQRVSMIQIHKHSLLNEGNSRQMDQQVVHFFDEVNLFQQNPLLSLPYHEDI